MTLGFGVCALGGCIEYQLIYHGDGAGGCPDAVQEWDSGESVSTTTERVSAPSGYALTGVRVFREPSANLDNFVARFDVEFTRYSESSGLIRWTDDTVVETVYNGEFRSDSGVWVRAEEDEWITGLTAYVQNRDGYLKDVVVTSSRILSTGVSGTSSEGPALGLSGRIFRLGCGDCDSVQLIDEVEIEWDTRRGKTRRLEIHCGSYSYDRVD